MEAFRRAEKSNATIEKYLYHARWFAAEHEGNPAGKELVLKYRAQLGSGTRRLERTRLRRR